MPQMVNNQLSEQQERINKSLEWLRRLMASEITEVFFAFIPQDLSPSAAFWNNYDNKSKAIGY